MRFKVLDRFFQRNHVREEILLDVKRSAALTIPFAVVREVLLQKGVKPKHAEYCVDALLLLVSAYTQDLRPTLVYLLLNKLEEKLKQHGLQHIFRASVLVAMHVINNPTKNTVYDLARHALATLFSFNTSITFKNLSNYLFGEPDIQPLAQPQLNVIRANDLLAGLGFNNH
jgi:hypothetical protein